MSIVGEDMKNSKKILKSVLPIVVLILAVVLCIGIGIKFVKPKEKKKEKVDFVISSELKKDKKFLDLTLQDIDIEEGENIVHLMANIYNHGEAFADRMVDIVFLDQEGKELGKTPTYISSIEKDGAVRIDTVIDRKYAKAYTFKVEG